MSSHSLLLKQTLPFKVEFAVVSVLMFGLSLLVWQAGWNSLPVSLGAALVGIAGYLVVEIYVSKQRTEGMDDGTE